MIGFLIIMALLGFPFLGIALYLSFTVLPIILGLGIILVLASFLEGIFFPPKP